MRSLLSKNDFGCDRFGSFTDEAGMDSNLTTVQNGCVSRERGGMHRTD